MRPRRDISLTLALCLSLAAHAWIVKASVEGYVGRFGRPSIPPVSGDALRRPPPEAPAEPPAKAPDPPVIVSRPTLDPMDRLGDSTGAGQALASADGDQPQQAPQADQEQAQLSPTPGTAGAAATDAPPTLAQPARPPAPPAFAEPPIARTEFRVPGPAVSETARPEARQSEKLSEPQQTPNDANPARSGETAIESEPPKPSETEPAPEPQRPIEVASAGPIAPPDQSTEPAPPSKPASTPGGEPGAPSDSSTDAFSTSPAIEFQAGRTVARLGRKHRIIRPKLEMVAYADMMQVSGPIRVVLRIYTDASGNVEKVDLVRPSGILNLDQPLRQVAYRWWFEPRKDSAGRPMPDVFEFTCVWK